MGAIGHQERVYERDVPGPPGYPLVGALPKIAPAPLPFLVEAARTYGGVVRLGARRWGLQWFLVSDPDSVKYVLQENARNYRRGLNAASVALLLGQGLL